MRNMNVERFTELRESLNGEEARMKSLRAAVDPAQISELENTRKLLDYWEYQARGMVNWNLENEDGTMYRLVFQTHDEVLKLVEKDDPSQSKAEGFPTSKRQMLDKLQVRLSVFDDRVEVKSLFPVEPIGIQSCTSARGDKEGFIQWLVSSPPVMHFTKMRGGSQDKGHEYSGRGPKVLCFGRLTSKQMYKVRELPSLLADNQLPFPVNACADAGMQPPVNQNRRGLLRIP